MCLWIRYSRAEFLEVKVNSRRQSGGKQELERFGCLGVLGREVERPGCPGANELFSDTQRGQCAAAQGDKRQ